jgi:glycerol uptake facilitator-like aquaporin
MIYNRKLNTKGMIDALLYMISQVIGAYLGALMSITVDSENIIYIQVHRELSNLSILFTEFFFTGTFIFVILFVVSEITKPSKDSVTNCAIVISWFYMCVNAGASISGAGYNPAVLIVANSIAYWWKKDEKAMDKVFYMIIAEFIGAFVAAIAFKYVYEPYYGHKHKIMIKRKSKLISLNNE